MSSVTSRWCVCVCANVHSDGALLRGTIVLLCANLVIEQGQAHTYRWSASNDTSSEVFAGKYLPEVAHAQ